MVGVLVLQPGRSKVTLLDSPLHGSRPQASLAQGR
jgi:hypothetical protein